jgi:Polyketide cyclase / dehydrase and lipid transport
MPPIAIFIIPLTIIGILIYASTRPNTFRIERSVLIKGTQARIFGNINDLSKWPTWSPWEKLDPKVQRTLSDPTSGVGASYAWEGNRKVGKGSMEIVESVKSNKVVMKLEFYKPFRASNIAEFTLTKKGTSTEVTWAMYGPQPYKSKLMGTLMDIDGMVGKQFAEGLANLKALVEK